MDLATILSVVQTILSAIQSLDQLKVMFSFSDFERRLEDLLNTVNYVKSVLEDAEAKHDALSNQEKNYIQELKDAVYDADDVLDEFLTLVKQKQLTKVSDKFSDKMKSCLSCFNHLTHNMSSKVEEVNKKLDVIASKSSKFMFKVDTNPTKFIKDDTSSFVSVNDPIVGRGEDLEKMVEMLINSGDVLQRNNVSSLAIVGMGGLGKTALAQRVYNDPRITSAFQLKSWTCIADENQWNSTYLLSKIVKELPGDDNKHDLTSLEQIHGKIKKELEGKKCLFVLDDVWTENYHQWRGLEKVLLVRGCGSRIVVTTRSRKTAKMIGGDQVHELQGLSKEDSWRLFESIAFLPKQIETPDEDLVILGKDIVEKCINVPLAIRVVASLLHGESKATWISFRDKELANIISESNNDDTMKNILSLSYHQLDRPLKSCFAYCAIFPKNAYIYKDMLICLWMAQGYINAEDVGEKYLLILLQRCFFHDVEVDDSGEMKLVKIHDLLHDIAEQAVGEEVCRLISYPFNLGRKVRHLSLLFGFCPQEAFKKSHIRTCFQIDGNKHIDIGASVMRNPDPRISDQLLAGNIIRNWTSLRFLDLRALHAKRLPKFIGELCHLRFLNLSESHNLEVLPNSITKLVNLQTLLLRGCKRIRELPKDMCKLVNLRTLNTALCDNLSHMPSKLGMLTNLHSLSLYVLGEASSDEKQFFVGMEDLRSLNNLKGHLEIRIVCGPWKCKLCQQGSCWRGLFTEFGTPEFHSY